MSPHTVLDREFYGRDALEVAPDLLNTVLVVGDRAARIVEVEAYRGEDDPASHGARGLTERTRTMFGPPGHLYVYFSYGMHWCANVVCGADGECAAVLLRAAEPICGLEAMWAARASARRSLDLCNGPAKLCQAMGIGGDDDGADLVTGRVRLVSDDTPPPTAPVRTTRVGLSVGKGHDLPWRFCVPDDPHVSRPRPAGPARGR